MGEYRGLIGSRRHSGLGMLVLPIALVAISSGIGLFLLMLFLSVERMIAALEIRAGIPLSYALLPHGTFDWFYFPVNFYLSLAVVVLLTSITLIAIGKRISKTPGNIAFGLISYTFLYGFIVPIWLIRATSDVVFGKRRNWRY